jgi:hypothetical protein
VLDGTAVALLSVWVKESGMSRSPLLIVDGSLNLMFGVLLLVFPRWLVDVLGIPAAEVAFYASVLGGVLVGIGIALLIECVRRQTRPAGLGLAGAMAINVCVGLTLAGWLVFGRLDIPTRGYAVLWIVVALALGISIVELLQMLAGRPTPAT